MQNVNFRYMALIVYTKEALKTNKYTLSCLDIYGPQSIKSLCYVQNNVIMQNSTYISVKITSSYSMYHNN